MICILNIEHVYHQNISNYYNYKCWIFNFEIKNDVLKIKGSCLRLEYSGQPLWGWNVQPWKLALWKKNPKQDSHENDFLVLVHIIINMMNNACWTVWCCILPAVLSQSTPGNGFMVTTQSLAILLIQYTFREPLKYKINVVFWITLKPHHAVDISPFFPQFHKDIYKIITDYTQWLWNNKTCI